MVIHFNAGILILFKATCAEDADIKNSSFAFWTTPHVVNPDQKTL